MPINNFIYLANRIFSDSLVVKISSRNWRYKPTNHLKTNHLKNIRVLVPVLTMIATDGNVKKLCSKYFTTHNPKSPIYNQKLC